MLISARLVSPRACCRRACEIRQRAQLVAAKSLLPAFADGPGKSALRIGARAKTTCEAKQRIAAVSSQVHLGN